MSLNGSPTVSPTTAALWASVPLPYVTPSNSIPPSIRFFALSQAPPAFDWKIASSTPDEVTPASSPPSISLDVKPTTTGTSTPSSPGRIISRKAAFVEISTQCANSAGALPSRNPGISLNWRPTSVIMSLAARPTAPMASALNTNGSIAPSRSPAMMIGSEMSMVVTPAC